MRKFLLAWSILAGVWVVFLTESLSLVHGLDYQNVVIGWGLGFLAMAGVLYRLKIYPKPAVTVFSLPLTAKILNAGFLILAGMLAFLALEYSPNTWDAMTYHLPRIEHWVQNRNIAYYPTHIIHQDTFPPLAEWCLLQFRLLTGSDRLYGLLQWLSMSVSAVGVSLIAGCLGASLTGQALAAVLSAALPMGILQATSTQNDYVLTMWMVGFVYFFIDHMQSGRMTSLGLAGLSLGLAVLTKGYAYLYAVPFLIWFLVHDLKRWSWQRLRKCFMIVCVALVLNIGFFWRNWRAFGHLFLTTDPTLVCGHFSLSIWLADILRNAALHLGTIYGPFNAWVDGRLAAIAAFLHIDLNPPDGGFSTAPFQLPGLMFNEDYAGNLLSFCLFLLALIAALIQWSRRKIDPQWSYFWAVLGMFLLLSLVMRFQIFGSRFQLAIFVLGSAWCALIFEKLLSRWAWMAGVLVLAMTVPWLFFNHSKPLIRGLDASPQRRLEEYFINDPAWIMPMANVIMHLRAMDCHDVGFISEGDNKEYLWWVAMRFFQVPVSRLEHVDVTNQSAHLDYPMGNFNPCGIVLMSEFRQPVIILPSGLYVRADTYVDGQGNVQVALYVPQR